jgi:hypothetical protein
MASLAVRVALAVLAACGLGEWLRRRALVGSRDDPQEERLVRGLRGAALALSGFWALAWLILALLRLRYPFELEWIGGAMRDHCERLLRGEPLFTPPNADWIPYFYPPLYYGVSALAMQATGSHGFAPMRAVSLVATLGSAWLLFLWVRGRVDAERTTDRSGAVWGVAAAGIFLAAYRFTGAWYDVEHLDTLFLLLLLLGIQALERALPTASAPARSRPLSALLAGVLFSLAFLCKQQALLFLLAALGALAWHRAWTGLLLLGATALAGCLGPFLALDAASGGWYRYYVFVVPFGQGIQASLAGRYLLIDLPLFAPCLALIALSLSLARREVRARMREEAKGQAAGEAACLPPGSAEGPLTALIAMTGAALAVSLVSRAHWGGSENVLIPGYGFVGAAACVAAGRLERQAPRLRAPLFALLLAQLLVLTYRPAAQLPTAANRAAGERFAAAIRRLERDGEVLCLDHGSFTARPHLHSLALGNLLLAKRPVPPAVLAGLHAHRYAAIVSDALPPANDPLLQDYTPTECLDIESTWCVTAYATPNAQRRGWVLRPKPSSPEPVR